MSLKLLILLVFGFMHSDCSSAPVENVQAEEITLYIVDHGMHTGIVIDADSVTEIIQGLRFDFEEIRFIEFGWGDQAFYQADSFSVFLAIRALFFPTGSVMHVAGLSDRPEFYFRHSDIEGIPISRERLKSMLRYIDSSFARDSQDALIGLGRGLYAYSTFYDAKGRYHLLNNCNTWVMEALVEAGFSKRVWPTLTASSVMRQVRKFPQSVLVETE
ncbi:MAG: DUF2459 domain-containing protein [Methylobacter sp.]|uniref:DUF2459 domain-containing protein n=1 Tax=Candidatus Methylobacter titanis TaxID=3053457 RepID=A0AA43Q6A6_9GAMM|nr:DUF2459 domain-containing protein [Candidatus Methylobacter titanis]MDI1293803.1 DUF2459 domain-containing protein [Candidatus Methylobacter titanis]